MTHDREHSSSSASAPAPTSYEVDPGRANSSALMRKPDHAFASGLVQRKARDANGVAEGADSAVAAASSSSGSPLPETLQRKFESSLGADLSSVRVHTGNSSATANDAVGAKAYTMGNDIHFGAGNYDPSSADGEHLLAHEVAHTVQQGGGAQRMQFKLAVSSPGDAMEHEADRAADAMVSGAHAAVTSAGGLARKPTVPSPLGGAYTMDPLGLPKKGTPVGDVDDPKNFPASMSSDSKEFSDMAAAVAATEKAITTVKNVVGSFAASSRSSILGACALLNQMAAIEGKAYTRFANALTEGKMKVKEEHDEKVQFAVQLAVGFILDPIEHAVEHLVGSKAVTKVIMSVVETVVASPVEQADRKSVV